LPVIIIDISDKEDDQLCSCQEDLDYGKGDKVMPTRKNQLHEERAGWDANYTNLVTLITTFKEVEERVPIQVNLLRNCLEFKHKVKCVIFLNSTNGRMAHVARKQGWYVMKIKKVNKYGLPTVKDMFLEVMHQHNSQYYGFVNGDVLLSEGVFDTLEAISNQFKLDATHIGFQQPILVLGNRTNVEVVPGKDMLFTSSAVEELAKTEGEPGKYNFIDYVILTRNAIPWKNMPDVVVGRPFWDNLFPTVAQLCRTVVIDISNTGIILHQSYNGIARNHSYITDNHDMMFNARLIYSYFDRKFIKKAIRHFGFINHANYYSYFNTDGKLSFSMYEKDPEHYRYLEIVRQKFKKSLEC